MCGIAGTFAYGPGVPPVDEASLLLVREYMRSRGPDGEGLWISDDRSIGLAQRRLAIIDLTDGGRQPMRDPETGNVIVFNGEIYNHRALRKELEAVGYRFTSNSDTEVLLKLYSAHGPSFLNKLRGMYALAIHDAARNHLFLARDPFGIKPLYLADDGKTLRFASQVKALLAGGRVDERPDPAGHAGFFLWGSVPEPFTLFRGIRALAEGTSLTIKIGGARQESRHFDLAGQVDTLEPMPGIGSMEDARAILAEALRDSVRHHLVSDVPVGAFLSSGLDSCTLAALAREVGSGKLATLSLGFEEYRGTERDEVPLAEAMARQIGSDHRSRWISGDAFRADFDRLLDAMDQPSIDGVNTYFVCKAAREAGLKVAISGLGGDELFGGYGEFTTIPKLVRLAGIPSRLPGLGRTFRRATAPVFRRLGSPKYSGLLEYGGDFAGAYLLRRALFMPWELGEVLQPEIARAGWDELQALSALRMSMPGANSARLKVGALATSWYMRNQLLRDTDWASMAHSLEVRTPLVDAALWETVMRLLLAGYPVGKRDMALSPAMPLPSAILNRPKTGFSIPVREWLQSGRQTPQSAMSRGLRGWASLLYRKSGFADLLLA
jgi:asparagine synthase (glutamine-hydrolysing)